MKRFEVKSFVKYEGQIYFILYVYKSNTVRLFKIDDSVQISLNEPCINDLELLDKNTIDKEVVLLCEDLYQYYIDMNMTNFEDNEIIQKYVQCAADIVNKSSIYTFNTINQVLKYNLSPLMNEEHDIIGFKRIDREFITDSSIKDDFCYKDNARFYVEKHKQHLKKTFYCEKEELKEDTISYYNVFEISSLNCELLTSVEKNFIDSNNEDTYIITKTDYFMFKGLKNKKLIDIELNKIYQLMKKLNMI